MKDDWPNCARIFPCLQNDMTHLHFKTIKYAAVALALSLAICQPGFALNPVVQTIYTADPAPMVYGDTVYLYTGHDEDHSTWFTMKDWHCYSSKDMVNWTDQGSPLSLRDFSWARSDAWAGQCIERGGKFYYYVPITRKTGGMAIGVAVADSPTGPFKDALGHPLVFDGSGDIDPTVFIDDDGQAYLSWGNPTLKYVKLNPDMISYDTSVGDKGIFRGPMMVEAFGKRATTDRTTAYEEGPWHYKRNGIYYMVYAAGPVPEHLAYSTSAKPTGPWIYGGVIMPTQGGSFTNHPGIIDFKGHSYLFYHNGALPGGGGFTRSVCIEEFKYNPDGTIPPLNMTTAGTVALSNLDPYVRTEAETIAWESGIETQPCSQGGMNVYDINNGDYTRVKNVDLGTTGAATFTASVASDTRAGASRSGAIELHLDSADGPLVATLPVSYTGGPNNWKTATTNVSGANGVHDLFFVFRGEPTGDLFKFDYWQFARKSPAHQLAGLNASVDSYKIDTLPPGNKTNLKVMAIYSDGTSTDVTAHAQVRPVNAGIVTAKKGVLTGTASGSTTLTVSYGGKTDRLTMMVKDLKSEFIPRTITVSAPNIALLNGDKQTFSVNAEYLDGHIEDVTKTATYAIDNPNIASVEDGVATAKGQGRTTIQVGFKGEMGALVTTVLAVTVTNRDPFKQNEAEDFNEQSGIVVENSTESGKNVCDAQNGDWIKFSALDFGPGASSCEVRVASATKGGTLEIHLDSLHGPLVGTCEVQATGGWQNWVTKSCEIKDATGMHDVYFKFTGSPGILFNMNWWKFGKPPA